jgi:hypothetical protein
MSLSISRDIGEKWRMAPNIRASAPSFSYGWDMPISAVSRQDKAEQAMYVRLPKELHEAVKTRSHEDDRTMAQTIRVALRYYLSNTEPVAP